MKIKCELISEIITKAILQKKANLIDNLKQTWKLSNYNIDLFARRVLPFIKNYFIRRDSIHDINEMRKAIEKATNNEAKLVNKNNIWEIVPEKAKSLIS